MLFWPARRPKRHGPVRRVLVVRRCCLGDVLMTTPLLAALDAAYPDATIAYAVAGWSRAALAGNPRVGAILPLPERTGWRNWVRVVGRWRRGRFDLAVLPERSPVVHLAAWAAGIPRRVGLDSHGRGFALTDPVPVRGVRHEAERALDLARGLGLPVAGTRLEYRPDAAAVARVDALLAERGAEAPLWVVHPGGGANPGATLDAKRWPAKRFGRVAAALVARHGGTAILVGGPGECALTAAARAAMGAAGANALDLAGRLDFAALGALCARAALYVGNDSGPTHLAEACGAPVVAVFGPTDPAMYGPVDGVGEAVWDAAACAPYVVRGDLTRVGAGGNTRCIDAISVEDVLAAAERVLARAAARTRVAR
ncbi:MAG TPA: glycosyltransferase family 9 protein [Thermomicrobiales bacterium]|nr:glycosyltransferase family 9 protein [Thermomicrobiales bacterium]